ncbi:MAG TPA: acyl-CoA thioesterase [Planctomycetaceae bacterium]|nr:acyl-CoA thioesterase [Planctomycetaceae bacterium]
MTAPFATAQFITTRRVEFADTDMAGIIHFTSYFRYMEVTEHAFFRSLGFSIVGDPAVGWPRVHVACDFEHPLRFEEEVEAHLRVREKKERALTYDCIFRRVNPEPVVEVAHGALTVVCVTRDESGKMRAALIPDHIAGRIEVAPVGSGEGGGRPGR